MSKLASPKGVNDMTPQEIFDTVATHLFTQGERAGIFVDEDDDSGPEFECRYRTPQGAKCAVGVLLPDEVYDPTMEGSSVQGICERGFQVPLWMASTLSLLMDLQQVHDELDSWDNDESMLDNLRSVADEYVLDAGVLTNLSFNRAKSE
jgi:hypothetical protein